MTSSREKLSAAEILDRHGLIYETEVDGEMTKHRLRKCPVCKKGQWECALDEMMGTDGQPLIYPMCQHVEGVMYKDFMASLGVVTCDEKSVKEPSVGPLNLEANSVLHHRLKQDTEALRVRVPEKHGRDMINFNQDGGTKNEFQELLSNDSLAVTVIETEDMTATGLLAYRPVDINGAYHNGHLYYPVSALMRERVEIDEKDGSKRTEVQEHRKTVVVRSDGKVLSVKTSPAPKGSTPKEKVLRLSDNTLIEREPMPSIHSTWDWSSINRYQQAKQTGEEVKFRPMKACYDEIEDYLKNKVWLPYQDDYTILALAVVVTYVQPVFDAVPLFLANGPKGSGKTELGRAMVDLCANAALIGQGTAAAIARLIDQSRGFVVLDDLESVGRKKDDQFSELIQGLKLSYKQSTAIKVWTDVKTMEPQKLNFFGVKMINNTSGVDAILGSRMYTIQTRRMLPAEKQAWEETRRYISEQPLALRNDLHTWAFQNVRSIDQIYRNMFPHSGERSDEIAAPLRVLAEIIDDAKIKQSLEAALMRHATQPKDLDDPVEIVEEALQNLVLEGYFRVSNQHIIMEMRKIAPENYGMERTTDIPEFLRPEWVGRTIRNQGWIVGTKESEKRVRHLGMNLRTHQIADSFIGMIRDRVAQEGADNSPWEDPEAQAPLAFCSGCEGCPYRSTGCDWIERRLEHDKSSRAPRTYQ